MVWVACVVLPFYAILFLFQRIWGFITGKKTETTEEKQKELADNLPKCSKTEPIKPEEEPLTSEIKTDGATDWTSNYY